MCDMTGYDVVYGKDKVYIEQHFCRSLNCGGGFSFQYAKQTLVNYFENRLTLLKECQTFKEYEDIT